MCAMLKTLRRKSTLGNIAAVNVVFVDIPSGKSHVLPSKVSPFQDMKLGMHGSSVILINQGVLNSGRPLN